MTLASGATIFNNFGVGLVGTSKDNLIERNKIGGNSNGIFIDSTTQGGNVFRRNLIVGNPAAAFGSSTGADIQDLSPAGANTFEDNRCLTYAGALMDRPPCPNISKRDNDEDRQDREIAAFGRSRLVFPEARLVETVFHPGPRALRGTNLPRRDLPARLSLIP